MSNRIPLTTVCRYKSPVPSRHQGRTQCLVGVNVVNKQSTPLFRPIRIYILSLSTYINLRVGGDI